MSPDELVTLGGDACTLNNLMNAVQIAILIALLRWVRSGNGTPKDDPPPDPPPIRNLRGWNFP